ncbi:MAG: thiol-disulfide oxidoreductase DCC family protein [Verrucomicrobia bacterium]|jgi:predicted DCC family thiol-disulfide oxidoreductase YuxK|nr:thiol-disulfide oxidoreductase DCC family protein [Verrucomicrobiota bacterium]MBT7065072.1 thiol-disulfide oxidoreductase DCC family protein [Verrucomicrobiota bacterium]MBT7699599.1 thiol-disulfide oxidoreductase DCC family protein [Verrucomicrobiota bacterium]
MSAAPVVVFDGVCNFCVGAVRFIIKRDPKAIFRFTPMQGALGQALIREHGLPGGGDALLLVKAGRAYSGSDAALEIAQDLSGGWPLCRFLRVVPRPLRDGVYRLIGRHRYALFGRRSACMLPSPEQSARFIMQRSTRPS